MPKDTARPGRQTARAQLRIKRRSRRFFFGGGRLTTAPQNPADCASDSVFFAFLGFLSAPICRFRHSSVLRLGLRQLGAWPRCPVCLRRAPFRPWVGAGRRCPTPSAWRAKSIRWQRAPCRCENATPQRFEVAARAFGCQRCGSTGVWLPGVSTARRRRRPEVWLFFLGGQGELFGPGDPKFDALSSKGGPSMLAQREAPLWDSAPRVTDGWRVEGVAPILRADYALLLALGVGAWAQSVSAASLNGALRVKKAGKPVIGPGLIFFNRGDFGLRRVARPRDRRRAHRLSRRGANSLLLADATGSFCHGEDLSNRPGLSIRCLSVARIDRRFGRFGEARERGLGRQGLARQSAIDETCLINWNIYDNSLPLLKFC